MTTRRPPRAAPPRSSWSSAQREAARKFLEHVQPHNEAVLVENLEDFMPPSWRAGFEAIFAELRGGV